MAKLKEEPIQEKDLLEFLGSSSDFSFELSVLKMLRENELECKHGGLYEDPVTGKSREFDIRAVKTLDRYKVRLAIECKNIRENFPVLVSCIPRHSTESYHQVALVSEPKSEGIFSVPLTQSRANVVKITGQRSIYKPDVFIGKSVVQVGRSRKGAITANDGELFDKWSQALSSAQDLVERMYWDGDADKDSFFLSTMIPVLVIPSGKLWTVNYDADGNRVSDPSQASRCSCFVDKHYEIGPQLTGASFWISHIEIMTYDGLNAFVDDFLRTEEGVATLFSQEGIMAALDLTSSGKT